MVLLSRPSTALSEMLLPSVDVDVDVDVNELTGCACLLLSARPAMCPRIGQKRNSLRYDETQSFVGHSSLRHLNSSGRRFAAGRTYGTIGGAIGGISGGGIPCASARGACCDCSGTGTQRGACSGSAASSSGSSGRIRSSASECANQQFAPNLHALQAH